MIGPSVSALYYLVGTMLIAVAVLASIATKLYFQLKEEQEMGEFFVRKLLDNRIAAYADEQRLQRAVEEQSRC